VVQSAVKMDEISYDEMLELAGLGARVLQSRAVEFGKKYEVELEVLSSFEHKPGTIVKEEVKDMEDILVRGIAADKDQAKVTIQAVEDRPGMAAHLFKELAEAHVNVDMIVQNVSEESATDISFTVPRDDLVRTENALEGLSETLGAKGVNVDEDIAKLSIVGVGMRNHSGVAHRLFDALARNEINIQMISTSEIKVSVLIKTDQADKAMEVLHEEFKLEELGTS
ncbi:MAG: aspartate kinase, partial [Verrucomicrobiota bacterium]